MRLVDFIRGNRDAIVAEWETFARSLVPEDAQIGAHTLRDHAEGILEAVAEDMSLSQSSAEQVAKSHGRGTTRMGVAGKIHAILRIHTGFRLDQLVAEYRAMRASVLRLWEAGETDNDLEGAIRFNEAIDEALTESTNRYMEMIERHRDEFLGILGHDLRNPLGAIVMGSSLLTEAAGAPEKTVQIAHCINASAKRMDRMVSDLLDLTRASLGAGFELRRADVNLADVCHQVVSEIKGGHPGDPLTFSAEGDLHGNWDADRLAQVVSNLVGNALQHGKEKGTVSIVARGEPDDVVLDVHNEGPPIPPQEVCTLFDAMVSRRRDDNKKRRTSHHGRQFQYERNFV